MESGAKLLPFSRTWKLPTVRDPPAVEDTLHSQGNFRVILTGVAAKEVGKALLHGQQADIKSSDLTLVQEGRRRGYYDSGTYKTWKKCGNCGFETEEDFEYCPKCGRRL